MKDRKKPEKFLPPHGMPSDGCEFAFSSRVPPKALTIKIPYTSWNYQFMAVLGDPDDMEGDGKRRMGAMAIVTHVPQSTQNLLKLPPKGGGFAPPNWGQ